MKRKLTVILSLMILFIAIFTFMPVAHAASNPFPWGWCTWYAWQRAYDKWGTDVPVRGNAKTWHTEAKNANWPVDSTPKSDSIAVWTSGYYGHVAYVEKVEGSIIYISEMNFNGGFGVVSEGYFDTSTGMWQGTSNDNLNYERAFPEYYIHITSTVTFNANGGTGAPGNLTKVAGLMPNIPTAKPTRAGYSFLKWNNSADGNGPNSLNPGDQWGGDVDITFYAIWKAETGSEMKSGYSRTISNGDYLIVPTDHSDYFLDIYGTDKPAKNGTKVTLWSLDRNNVYESDIWTVSYSNGFYTIKQKGTNRYLDVEKNNGSELKAGTKIQVWEGTNIASNQQWAISKNGNGYRLQARCSGMSLDVSGGSFQNDVKIQQYDGNDTSAQRWTFLPYKNGKVVFPNNNSGGNTQPAVPAAPQTNVSFSFEDTNQMYFMSETTAQFGYIIVSTNGNINDVKTSGCELADSRGNILATHEEPSYYKNGKILHYFRINGDPKESDICYTLSPGTNYKFRSYVIYNGKKYYSSWRDFKTNGVAATPVPVTAEFSFEDTDQMYFMNDTTAQFGYIIVTANVNINDVKTSGCELADASGNILAAHEEPSYYKNGKILHYFRINGDPNESDICYALSPGTSYKFRSYVIYNGKKYYSGWRDFKTTGSAAPASSKEISFSFEDTNQMYFMNETTAQFGYIIVTANVNINDVKISGCELADKDGNLLATHEEPSYYKNGKILHYFRINGDPNESDICYTLSPGTSYKFRSYVIYNGQKYYSGWRDFTTTGTPPGTVVAEVPEDEMGPIIDTMPEGDLPVDNSTPDVNPTEDDSTSDANPIAEDSAPDADPTADNSTPDTEPTTDNSAPHTDLTADDSTPDTDLTTDGSTPDTDPTTDVPTPDFSKKKNPARFLKDDGNVSYHAAHLYLHIGSKNCKVSTDYVKVRKEIGSNTLVGHLEQADTFTLDAVNGNWAKITVTRPAKTSPDSREGMTGWVDADYMECPCSYDEYYSGNAHLVYSIGAAVKNGVNLRELPSKESTLFAALKKGERAEILSEYAGKDQKIWYRCRYEGKMGFIRSDMLEIIERDLPEGVARDPSETEGKENQTEDVPGKPDSSDESETTEQQEPLSSSGSDSGLISEDSYYESDNYNTDEVSRYIPLDVYADRQVYHAGETITFGADILGGVPPFSVHWVVEESQTRDGDSPLDQYINTHPEYVNSTTYATNDRHVEFSYTAPVDSLTLYGMVGITDANGIGSYRMDEDLAGVCSIREWNEMYPNTDPVNISLPFVAKTNMDNVPVWDGVWDGSSVFAAIGTKGTSVRVVDRFSDTAGEIWYKVRLNVRQAGYVKAEHLEIPQPAVADEPGITSEESASDPQSSSQPEEEAAHEQQTQSGGTEESLQQEADSSWRQIYHDYIMERNFLLNYHQEESQEIGDEYYTDAFGCDYYVNEYYDIWFALYDMDRNGIPELITYSGYGEGAGGAAYAFTVENGMMKYLGLVGTRESLLFCYDSDEYPGIFESGGHMGSYYTAYSYLENGEIKGESVEEHEGWYNDNEEFVESNYVYTDDAGLLDLYQNGKPYGIGEYTYEQIQMMGWDQFLLTVGRDQRTQTANENNQSGAEENSNNGVDYQQSSVVSMNRADWTGYDWNNAKDFRDVLFDSEIYSGDWKETYLRILQKNESGIRHHILYCDKYALEKYGYDSGIIFYDITHDGIPEMLFIKAYLEENNDGKDCYEGDLYIYTNDGTQTKCMLSIPDFYCCDWNGPYYSILYDLNNPSLLYLQYRDPYVWQVEYVLNGSATRGTTYRAISPDGDDGTLTSHFYINGTEVSETEAETYWIHPDYPSYCILSSMYYPSFVQGIDYDAAVTFLSDASSVIGSQHGTYPRQAKTLRNNVYLYAGTNQDSRQDGIIRNAGTEVTVLGVACDNYDSPWYFVRTNNGEKGYVPYEVLSYVSGETSSVVTSYVSLNDGADNILFYAKTTKATNVRVSADKKSDLVVKISDKGTEVTVLEKVTGADNKEWYRIQLPDGTVGYARYDFFRKVDK